MDGELPGTEQLVVRQHLASCKECRTEYEALRYTKQLLSRMKIKEPRPDLPQDIVQRLHREAERATHLSVEAIWERFAERMRIVPPMARNLAFGASLAVIGFGFVAMQPDNSDEIHWNVASASQTPLAPAPLGGSADPLAAVNSVQAIGFTANAPQTSDGYSFGTPAATNAVAYRSGVVLTPASDASPDAPR